MDSKEELTYLINPILYDKYKKLSCNDEDDQYKEEKKFYRKRIQQMAKDCSKLGIGNSDISIPMYIGQSFDNFSKTCIEYFKIQDENEFYQTEYNDLSNDTSSSKATSDLDGINLEELNIDLLSKPKNPQKIVTINDFVIKKPKKPTNSMPLPKQRNANVKDEKYRTKGVKKKKLKKKSND